MQNLMRWKCGQAPGEMALPSGFITFGPAFTHDDVPPEALMFLPRTKGSRGLLDQLTQKPDLAAEGGVGLFLVDPFLNLEEMASRLLRCGVSWVCNLPTVAQCEAEFVDQIADVGFTHDAEIAALERLAVSGLNILISLTHADQVARVSTVGARAILVMPTIADMQAGFASRRQRSSAATDVRRAVDEAGLDLPVLCLMSRDELEQGLKFADGALLRPELL